MHTKSDEEIILLNIGDVVRESGMRQSMRIIECRSLMPHIHMEAPKTVHYKCEWRRPDGRNDSAWFPAHRLQKAW